jgi:hypothetical protein
MVPLGERGRSPVPRWPARLEGSNEIPSMRSHIQIAVLSRDAFLASYSPRPAVGILCHSVARIYIFKPNSLKTVCSSATPHRLIAGRFMLPAKCLPRLEGEEANMFNLRA